MHSKPSAVELAAAGAGDPAGEYDEMVSGSGAMRPHWRALVGTLHAMPDGAFAERVARVYRQHQDVASAYELESENRNAEVRRPFDLLPLLITPREWAHIEAALSQRAQLMDLIV